MSANNYGKAAGTVFSVVRYGNVMGSRGSVIPFFQDLAKRNLPIPITDKRMTRFWISLDEAVKFIIDSFKIMQGGELYVPRIPSMRLIDLAEVISPNSNWIETGIRPGEKLHEEMISSDDSRRTVLLGNRYVVNPVAAEWGYESPNGTNVPEGFAYKSDTNDLWVTKSEMSNFLSKKPV